MIHKYIKMAGYSYSCSGIDIDTCARYVARFPVPADSVCSIHLSFPEIIEWIDAQLLRIQIFNGCDVAFSSLTYHMPWMKIELIDGRKSFAYFWLNLLIKNVLILGENEVLDLHSAEHQFSGRFYPISKILDNKK
jgi:hypothetical protein